MRFWQNFSGNAKRWAILGCVLGLSVAPFSSAQVPGIREQLDSLAAVKADTLDTTPPAKTKKIPVVDRQFNYRRQLGMALGMMAFALLFLTSTQSWNPD